MPVPAHGAVEFELGSHVEMAARVISILEETGKVVCSDGELRQYSPELGIWRSIEDNEINDIVRTFDGAEVAANRDGKPLRIRAADINGVNWCARDQVRRDNFFADAPGGIAFRNGFVKLSGGKLELEPHQAENTARRRVEADFVRDPKTPVLDEFFADIFADASEEDRADRIALLQEFAGACLLGIAPSYQRCLLFFGHGSNGKSQVEHVFRAMFPPGSVVSLPPQQWGQRFQVSRLVGAIANIVDEIPEHDITVGDVFKSVVTGEPLHVERKHRDPFEFRPRAGHVFSANTLPGTGDLSEGFFRRFLLLRLSRDMRLASTHRVDAAQSVIKAEGHLLSSWACHGAARLAQQGKYTVPESSAALHAEWRLTCDSVALFVHERTRCRTEDHPGTRASALYASYRQWALDSGFRPVSSLKFSSRMAYAGVGKSKREDAFYYPVVVKLQEY